MSSVDKLFVKGISFGFMAGRGYYRSAAGQREIENICNLGVSYVALIATVAQESYQSTRMFEDFHYTPADTELAAAIETFHRHGIKVMLKPMIECLDSVWRGNICFPAKQMMIPGIEVDYWGKWFANYTECMAHYAQLAEENGVELFCIGCELMGCEPQENHWPAVIRRVREIYHGPVTYNANQYHPGKAFVRKWFSELDLLGVSFYTGTARPDPTATELAADLQPSVDALEAVVRETGVPLFFAECGSRSVVGGTLQPWMYYNEGDYDGESQANYLAGVVRAFSSCPWWKGLMWWKWDEQQKRPHYTQPHGDTGFTIHGKPAAQVMKRWCAGEEL